MKKCSCGELVEDHVRFHWLAVDVGHYVDDPPAKLLPPEDVVVPEDWPVRFKRSHDLWSSTGIHRAPFPLLPVPAKPGWRPEEVLRGVCNEWLELQGFDVDDLEQGYREDGSSRVGLGIGDCFITGHGVTAWIEYKRWDNEPSADQRAFGRRVLENGGIYLLVYELVQLEHWLRRLP